jgi:hypothetical protein
MTKVKVMKTRGGEVSALWGGEVSALDILLARRLLSSLRSFLKVNVLRPAVWPIVRVMHACSRGRCGLFDHTMQ